MRILLIGQPNTGKTTLFNRLTGLQAAVGNWSGVTVAETVGRIRRLGYALVDLPGVYDLVPISHDEAITVRALASGAYDGILNIVDASQLRRNLQLTLALLSIERPIVVALNMVDVAEAEGKVVDPEALADRLGVPVVPVVARTGAGLGALLEVLAETMGGGASGGRPTGEGREAALAEAAAVGGESGRTSGGTTVLLKRSDAPALRRRPEIDAGPELEAALRAVEPVFSDPMLRRFLAERYLEGASEIVDDVERRRPALRSVREQLASALHAGGTESVQAALVERRYAWIDAHLPAVVRQAAPRRRPVSERIDDIVTHPVIGIPLFIALMLFIFQWTFDWLGTPLSEALDAFFTGPLTEAVGRGLEAIGAAPFFRALIVEGIIAGVGAVLVFVPQIFILFFFISFLEDSGYLARVAVLMDRLMDRFGLSGKAFIPLIIGFGCNVPGVMAARTIESSRERWATALITPFMSCSARLVVYALFVGAFFSRGQGLVMLSLYLFGIAMALLTARLLTRTVLRGAPSMYLVELPPYRVPNVRTLLRSTWEKGKGFIIKAGTLIFGGSVVIWLLGAVGPHGMAASIEESVLALLGRALQPLFQPLGFGTWQAAVALITGFLAKEVVVATLGIAFYAGEGTALTAALKSAFTPLSAYAFLVFVALYVPCLATTATLFREVPRRRWTVLMMGYSFALAYVFALVIYQGGRLLGMGG
ncbi:MAG: ferrous iron transport protein B [Hydrogenibacillus schlegelii]|nr:ferrous iron transport protein B [Hydrogenibacillus schlegelii]